MIKTNNFDSQTVANFKVEIGLTGTSKDFSLVDFKRLRAYLYLKSIICCQSISLETIDQAIKVANVSGDFKTMNFEEIDFVTFALRQLTAKKFVAPSADNIPDVMLPDEITSENVESKLKAIAESAEATVAIDDGKKK